MPFRIIPRQSSLEKFSSFLDLPSQSENLRWVSQVRLKKNLLSHSSLLKEFNSEDEQFLYWLNILGNTEDIKVRDHLSAYLEEACFWAANKITRQIKLAKLSDLEVFHQAWRIAQDRTTNREQLLKRFRTYIPSISSVNTYSKNWLVGVIKDAIYAEYRIGKYTDWGILIHTGRINLQEALERSGYPASKVVSYMAAWQCFREIYTHTPGKHRLKSPNKQQIEEIVLLYHQKRESHTNCQLLTLNQDLFEQWMHNCTEACRKFEKSKCISSYAIALPDHEHQEQSEQQDSFLIQENNFLLWEQPSEPNYLAEKDINDYLSEAMDNLGQDAAKIIYLYYGLNFNQSLIGNFLQLEQYKISRYLKGYKTKLLKKLAQRLKPRVNLDSTSLTQLSSIIEEWLVTKCQTEISLQLGLLNVLVVRLLETLV